MSPRAAQLASPGLLYAQLSVSGTHLSLCIWPAFILYNAMPCSVTWRIFRSIALSKEYAVELRSTPGAEVPLSSFGESDESLTFRLANEDAQVIDVKIADLDRSSKACTSLSCACLDVTRVSALIIPNEQGELCQDTGRSQMRGETNVSWSAPLLLSGGEVRSSGWRGGPGSHNVRPALGERKAIEVGYKKRRITVEISAEEIAQVIHRAAAAKEAVLMASAKPSHVTGASDREPQAGTFWRRAKLHSSSTHFQRHRRCCV